MPTSKKRRKAPTVKREQTSVEAATLAALQDTLQLVKRSEEAILQHSGPRRAGKATLQSIHLNLRAAALGLMVAYSEMTGMPDPRSAEIAGKVLQ